MIHAKVAHGVIIGLGRRRTGQPMKNATWDTCMAGFPILGKWASLADDLF